eukprot:Nk52_evm1s2390 gene=Nk52_evmTU1s2390
MNHHHHHQPKLAASAAALFSLVFLLSAPNGILYVMAIPPQVYVDSANSQLVMENQSGVHVKGAFRVNDQEYTDVKSHFKYATSDTTPPPVLHVATTGGDFTSLKQAFDFITKQLVTTVVDIEVADGVYDIPATNDDRIIAGPFTPQGTVRFYCKTRCTYRFAETASGNGINHFMQLNRVSGISFENFTFEYAQGASAEAPFQLIQGSQTELTMTNCIFKGWFSNAIILIHRSSFFCENCQSSGMVSFLTLQDFTTAKLYGESSTFTGIGKENAAYFILLT